MIATTKFSMDLARPGVTPILDAVQEDKYSRELQIGLYTNGVAFPVPEDCAVLIRYGKPDGRGGVYDTMPDGTAAWSISGNEVTVRLAPQVCTVAGKVTLSVTLLHGGAELSCFPVQLNVHGRQEGAPESRQYIHITGFLPQTAAAQPGQYLKAAAVDENGRVTAVETGEMGGLPGVSTENEGAFLRVVDGAWAVAALESAEEVSF